MTYSDALKRKKCIATVIYNLIFSDINVPVLHH